MSTDRITKESIRQASAEELRSAVELIRRCRERPTMGLRSKRKGKRGKREVVSLARQHGLPAERTWATAQATDPTLRRCDVEVAGRLAQVKVASDGFRTLYEALNGVEMAFLRADRRPWLAVLPAEEFLRLLTERAEDNDEQ